MSGCVEGENSNYSAKIHKKAKDDLTQEGTAITLYSAFPSLHTTALGFHSTG